MTETQWLTAGSNSTATALTILNVQHEGRQKTNGGAIEATEDALFSDVVDDSEHIYFWSDKVSHVLLASNACYFLNHTHPLWKHSECRGTQSAVLISVMGSHSNYQWTEAWTPASASFLGMWMCTCVCERAIKLDELVKKNGDGYCWKMHMNVAQDGIQYITAAEMELVSRTPPSGCISL